MSDVKNASSHVSTDVTPPLGHDRAPARPKAPAAAPAGALRLVAPVPPERAPLLTRFVLGTSTRRVFVLRAESEVRCGRKKPTKGEQAPNHLVLRLLPCRSKEQDPDNWNATMAISSTHLSFVTSHDGIRLLDSSRNGTLLNGKPLQKGTPGRVTDAFQIMVGGVLRLRGRLIRADGDDSVDIACGVRMPVEDVLPPDAALPGHVNACVLDRVANAADDTYVLLYRRAAIGSSPECAIRVEGEGVAPVHAHLLRHRETLLLAAAPGAESSTVVDGLPLERGITVPLLPGSSIQLGELTIGVAPSRPAELASTPED
jgi:hypothetical protein